MSEAPWRTDPMYGGMSEESARRSYEASLLRRHPEPQWVPEKPFDHEDFERRKVVIEGLLRDYEEAVAAVVKWDAARRQRTPRGFKAVARQQGMA